MSILLPSVFTSRGRPHGRSGYVTEIVTAGDGEVIASCTDPNGALALVNALNAVLDAWAVGNDARKVESR